MKNPHLVLFLVNLANLLLESNTLHTPNFIATTQSMKEELLMKVRPLLLKIHKLHYENAMFFFKSIPIFDVESKRSY